MKKPFVTIFFGLMLSPLFVSAYDSYQSFRARPLSLNFKFQYYSTDANFNSEGQRDSLSSGYNYTIMDFNPYVRWQFDSQWAVLGGINISSAESKDFAFSRKNSLINTANIAAEYLFYNDLWLRWFARLGYVHPMEQIDPASDSVMTSNGASEINPEIVVNLDFADGVYSYLKGGLSFRGNGLSTLATYGLGTEVRFVDYGIGLSALGYLTTKEDEYTQRASYRDNHNNRVNAGSKIFNSINPNRHALEANFNFLMSSQSLAKIFIGYNIMGSNISTGYYGGVYVNWVLGGTSRSKSFPRAAPQKPKEPEVLFKEKTDDGVNQEYFKSAPTVVPPSGSSLPTPSAPPNGLNPQKENQNEYIKKTETPSPRPLDERPRRVFIDTTPSQRGKVSPGAKQIKIKLKKKTKPKPKT